LVHMIHNHNSDKSSMNINLNTMLEDEASKSIVSPQTCFAATSFDICLA